MAQSYKKRLLINTAGDDSLQFRTVSGQLVATGYRRVVIGKRGPYVEFVTDQMNRDGLFIPEDQDYRLTSKLVYYNEWRTKNDNIKVYEQKRTVTYADYIIGMWYVSPFDLRIDGNIIIRPQERKSDGDIFAEMNS